MNIHTSTVECAQPEKRMKFLDTVIIKIYCTKVHELRKWQGDVPAEKKVVICVFQFSIKPEVFKTTEILSKAS